METDHEGQIAEILALLDQGVSREDILNDPSFDKDEVLGLFRLLDDVHAEAEQLTPDPAFVRSMVQNLEIPSKTVTSTVTPERVNAWEYLNTLFSRSQSPYAILAPVMLLVIVLLGGASGIYNTIERDQTKYTFETQPTPNAAMPTGNQGVGSIDNGGSPASAVSPTPDRPTSEVVNTEKTPQATPAITPSTAENNTAETTPEPLNNSNDMQLPDQQGAAFEPPNPTTTKATSTASTTESVSPTDEDAR